MSMKAIKVSLVVQLNCTTKETLIAFIELKFLGEPLEKSSGPAMEGSFSWNSS